MGVVDHLRKSRKAFNKLARVKNMTWSSTCDKAFNMWASVTRVGKDEKHKTGGEG
jgi:hypothetical protein